MRKKIADKLIMNRFQDQRKRIDFFEHEFLVRCPHCQSCAVIFPTEPQNTDLFSPRRFSCKKCGASKDWSGRIVRRSWRNNPVDIYFQIPLWLQTACCGETLWAYNSSHLEFIEHFVQADLREHKFDDHYGWSNKSLVSRLPKWIQSRKNRHAILKAIAKLNQLEKCSK